MPDANNETIDIQAVPSARLRLLSAAENIILMHGVDVATARAICDAASTNVSQIRYYFGSMEGLLDTLLDEETAAVTARFAAVDLDDAATTLPVLMRTLLAALQTPAVYTRGGYAALAIERVHRHAGGAMRDRADARLEAGHRPFRAALLARAPWMDETSVRVRLAAVIAMAMSMLRGGTGQRLLTLGRDGETISHEIILDHVLAMAIAAWERPAA